MNYSDKNIKSEEKLLYEEYKKNVKELKKSQKEHKEQALVGQIFTKGLPPIYVLHILSLDPSNGNDISNKIGKRTKGLWTPSTGGIYPILKKLEKSGDIIGEWDNPEKKFQKIYRLTDQGKDNFEKKKAILKPRIEESLKVFKIIYKDIY